MSTCIDRLGVAGSTYPLGAVLALTLWCLQIAKYLVKIKYQHSYRKGVAVTHNVTMGHSTIGT